MLLSFVKIVEIVYIAEKCAIEFLSFGLNWIQINAF